VAAIITAKINEMTTAANEARAKEAAASAAEEARTEAAAAAAAAALQVAGEIEEARDVAAVARQEEEVILERALDPDEVMAQALARAQAAGLVGQYTLTPG
jgi:hypothetical protein